MYSLIHLLPCLFLVTASSGYDHLGTVADTLLWEAMERLQSKSALAADSDDYGLSSNAALLPPQLDRLVNLAISDAILDREPSVGNEEYVQHDSFYGPKSGGARVGYCNPANPCPLGYADDGCLQEFENTATFSREYQSAQDCVCDFEHMFDCPGVSRGNGLDASSGPFESEALADYALSRLFQDKEPTNPFLEGDRLPVIAKKAPTSSVK